MEKSLTVQIEVTQESGVSETGRAFLAWLAIYFGLHIVTRWLVSNNLQLDEAEQLVVTQEWRLGYGSQPPLYSWIQNALFHLLGMNVFALSFLKNVVLWTGYAFTYLAACEVLNGKRLAALATAGLLFFPQIAWESQRDQSHLVLATTCAAATLFVFARLVKAPKANLYALFGIVAALGFLSKYNYAVLPVALVCGALMTAPLRQVVLNRGMVIAAAVFFVVAGPHIVWMLEHKAAVGSQSYKFMASELIVPNSRLTGALQLLKATIAIAGIPILAFSPIFIRKWRRAASDAQPSANAPILSLLWRTLAAGLALTLIAVVAFGVTYIRDRWLQPLFFALPILLVGALHAQFKETDIKRLFQLAIAVAIMALAAINFTVFGANVLNRPHNLNIPYAALAEKLREAGFDRGTIIANGFSLGGNLKNQFRTSRVIVPEMNEKTPPQRPMLMIWSARTDAEPADFLQYASAQAGVPRNEFHPQFLEIPCHNGRRISEKFGFVLLR